MTIHLSRLGTRKIELGYFEYGRTLVLIQRGPVSTHRFRPLLNQISSLENVLECSHKREDLGCRPDGWDMASYECSEDLVFDTYTKGLTLCPGQG